MPTVLITGAAGGIGQALVRTFTDAGYHVTSTDCVEKPVGLLCETYKTIDLERLAADAEFATTAIADMRATLAETGLNVLINNAAIQILGGVQSLTRKDWRRSLDVNLLAPFMLTQALLKDLERVQGCVINISSIHARLTKKNFVAYATTKAALSGMTRSMAIDLGPRIRVNAIEPAAIATEMLLAGFENAPELYRQLENYHPQQRIGLPQDVANMALWLASKAAGFVHGECFSIDGGISGCLHDPV